MRPVVKAMAFLVSLGVLLPSAARAQGNPDWHRRIPGLYVAEREQAFEKELAKQTADAHAGNTVGFEKSQPRAMSQFR